MINFADHHRHSTMNTSPLILAFRIPLLVLLSTMAGAHAQEEKIWHVKAIHPEGRLLDVKALDKDGGIHGVKAIEADNNLHLMDIKAFVGGKRLPIKVLARGEGDKYEPVKAIGEDGTIYAIKALTAEGTRLDVKGVKRSGNIIHIKAIGPNGEFYGIKALSPEGRVYDVKGIRLGNERIEGKVHGVEFVAHIKALPQAPEAPLKE
jgi:hypothetical protein